MSIYACFYCPPDATNITLQTDQDIALEPEPRVNGWGNVM